jgi:hypothetical protein
MGMKMIDAFIIIIQCGLIISLVAGIGKSKIPVSSGLVFCCIISASIVFGNSINSDQPWAYLFSGSVNVKSLEQPFFNAFIALIFALGATLILPNFLVKKVTKE